MLPSADPAIPSRILVADDGSDRAQRIAPTAASLARALDRPLEHLHVVTPSAPDERSATGTLWRRVTAADAVTGLRQVVEETDPPGLLCLATRGRGPLTEALFGSTAASVLRDLHHPMLLAGPAIEPGPADWSRVLVCLDGSARAEPILRPAAGLAETLGLEIELLHVTYPLGGPYEREREEPEELKVVIGRLHQLARELESDGHTVRVAIEEYPDAVAGILEHSQRLDAVLVAMATHGRTGLARLLAGSTTLATVARARGPVLTVRPRSLDEPSDD